MWLGLLPFPLSCCIWLLPQFVFEKRVQFVNAIICTTTPSHRIVTVTQTATGNAIICTTTPSHRIVTATQTATGKACSEIGLTRFQGFIRARKIGRHPAICDYKIPFGEWKNPFSGQFGDWKLPFSGQVGDQTFFKADNADADQTWSSQGLWQTSLSVQDARELAVRARRSCLRVNPPPVSRCIPWDSPSGTIWALWGGEDIVRAVTVSLRGTLVSSWVLFRWCLSRASAPVHRQ